MDVGFGAFLSVGKTGMEEVKSLLEVVVTTEVCQWSVRDQAAAEETQAARGRRRDDFMLARGVQSGQGVNVWSIVNEWRSAMLLCCYKSKRVWS